MGESPSLHQLWLWVPRSRGSITTWPIAGSETLRASAWWENGSTKLGSRREEPALWSFGGKSMGILGDLPWISQCLFDDRQVRPGFWVWSSIIFFRDPQVSQVSAFSTWNGETSCHARYAQKCKSEHVTACVSKMCLYTGLSETCVITPKCHGRSSCSLFSIEHLVYRGMPMFTLLGLMFPNTSFFLTHSFPKWYVWHHQVHPPSN